VLVATKVAEAAAEAEAPKRKRRKGKLILVVVVLLIVAGAAGYLVLGRRSTTTRAKVPATPVAYALPQLTTNLDDGHIVQAQLLLELAPGDSTATVAKDLARLENQEILTFGSMTYSQLLPTSGRQQAAAMLASAFNRVLAKGRPPHDRVVSILFESFIVQ
jgi:flagellar FliL protein